MDKEDIVNLMETSEGLHALDELLREMTGCGYGGSRKLVKLDKMYEVMLKYSRYNDDLETFFDIVDDDKKTLEEKCKELYDINIVNKQQKE